MSSPLPDSMQVIAIQEPGGPDVLKLQERRIAVPYEGEVLIKVSAAGVNRPDILQRQGAYPPPKGASDLPGLEVAGTIVKLGRNTSRYKIGDTVCALCPGGGYAQYAAVPEGHALPIPDGLDFTQAAALPETFFTVWTNVFQRGALQSGETLLIHGGSSGIGTTAIQIAKARGAIVIATAGSDEKCAACKSLGADHTINYQTTDYVDAVKDITGGAGANVILDMVGGDYIERNYRAAAIEGRIIQIAFLNGAIAEVDFTRLMIKRLTHTGSTLRPQSVAAKAKIAQELEAEIWPLIANGTIAPRIDKVFRFENAAEAHTYMETGTHIGKIVLTLD
ncbi:NAD(P)H-quinone oxidoreductase [Pararhizobium sp. IMCC21322]|uniref:NAD(P)H-quinone oxidoreductase n=1 Tax=Pararhizobium sp. IMCC21322 TaxID=3067903 RepID=UPI00274211BB|nr:NAD(P)H-quinone oxidoreductase [Pararhizobium sp. IMCC21322]